MKNNNKFIAGLVFGFAVVFAVAVVVWRDKVEAPMEESDRATSTIVGPMAEPTPDMVAVAVDAAGDTQTVTSQADNYSFDAPMSWYVEKNDDTGVTVYPDYDPAGDAAPDCKIDVASVDSATAAPADASGLHDWVTAYLHEDPTAEVDPAASMADLSVDGADSAVKWEGDLNGSATTLVYALVNDQVFEIAPSLVDETADSDPTNCNLMLDALTSNLHFGQ